MPNIRFTLWIALGAVLYYNYLAWQQDYRPSPQLTSATAGAAAGTHGSLFNSVPTPDGAAAIGLLFLRRDRIRHRPGPQSADPWTAAAEGQGERQDAGPDRARAAISRRTGRKKE